MWDMPPCLWLGVILRVPVFPDKRCIGDQIGVGSKRTTDIATYQPRTRAFLVSHEVQDRSFKFGRQVFVVTTTFIPDLSLDCLSLLLSN